MRRLAGLGLLLVLVVAVCAHPSSSREELLAESVFEGTSPSSAGDAAAGPHKRELQEAEHILSELRATTQATFDQNAASAHKPAKGGHRGNTSLPVSMFGVPSVSDEECVLCQYFVQRIQNGVADKIDNAPGGGGQADASSGAAGLPGAAAAAQQLLKVRNTIRKITKKAGGRGVVRVVAEDLVQHLCAVDEMPLLFNPYCSAFTEPNTINVVRKGIFFNLPTAEICQQAALCRDDSYLATNAGVHSQKVSAFLNGQRGICGMLGGARDRLNSREGLLLNLICAHQGAEFGEEV